MELLRSSLTSVLT